MSTTVRDSSTIPTSVGPGARATSSSTCLLSAFGRDAKRPPISRGVVRAPDPNLEPSALYR